MLAVLGSRCNCLHLVAAVPSQQRLPGATSFPVGIVSIKLMAAVFELDVPPTEKLVLLVLADFAGHDGRNCFPSVETICHRTSLRESTVRRDLGSLREKGLIEVEKPSTQHFPTRYIVSLRPLPGRPLPSRPLRGSKKAAQTSTTYNPDLYVVDPIRQLSTNKDDPSVLSASEKPASRASRWPDGLSMTGEMRNFALSKGVGDPEKEWGAFEDYHRAKGSRFLDWKRAWQTWVRNAVRFGRVPNGINSREALVGSGPEGNGKSLEHYLGWPEKKIPPALREAVREMARKKAPATVLP